MYCKKFTGLKTTRGLPTKSLSMCDKVTGDMPVSVVLGTAHPTMVARGLPTNSVNMCEIIKDELGMTITTKTGVAMANNTFDYGTGLGTAVNLPKGLANSKCVAMEIPNPETGPPKVRSILPMAQKLGLGIADLTKGVSKMGLNLSKLQDVVVRTPESMLTKCVRAPLPEKPNFKSKKIISKVAIPNWLLNWQKRSEIDPTHPDKPHK
jgi:hypothetical protein